MKTTICSSVTVLYLTVTAAALLFTLPGVQLPFLPYGVLWYAYGMMAPYQYHEGYNQDLRVEHQEIDGHWEIIDHHQYVPFLRGERVVRSRLVTFERRGAEAHRQAYCAWADVVRKEKNIQGAIRFTWEQWPQSPRGFEALRIPEHTSSSFLAECS